MHELALQLKTSVQTGAQDSPFIQAEAHIFVNNRPLLRVPGLYTFDLRWLLSNKRSGMFDLYTCDCGSASCAGIYCNTEVCISDEAVSWLFPDDPFMISFLPSLVDSSKPLQFIFKRTEFDVAVRNFSDEMSRVSRDLDLPIGRLVGGVVEIFEPSLFSAEVDACAKE